MKLIKLYVCLFFFGGLLLVSSIGSQTVQKKDKNKPASGETDGKVAEQGNQTSSRNFPNIKIKNFGEMDKKFYRGAQPKKDDYQSLKELGVKTVIDLRNDPTDYEKEAVEALGMKYINIPMSDKEYPKNESIEEFLKLAGNPRTGIFFVHCEGGRHRTGVIGAVYRLTKYGWTFEQAFEEMKTYDFYTRFGHGAMKDFVVDYAAKIKARKD